MIRDKFMRGICILSGICLLFTGCGDHKESVLKPDLIEPVGMDIDTVKVERMDLSKENSLPGTLVPVTRDVVAPEDCVVKSVRYKVGDKVKKGQILAIMSVEGEDVKDIRSDIKQTMTDNAEKNSLTKIGIKQTAQQIKKLKKEIKRAKDKNIKKSLKSQLLERKETLKVDKIRYKWDKRLQALDIRHKKKKLSDAIALNKRLKLKSPVDADVLRTEKPMTQLSMGDVVITLADMDKLRIQTTYISDDILGHMSSYLAQVNGKMVAVKKEPQDDYSDDDVEEGLAPESSFFNFTDEAPKAGVGNGVSIKMSAKTKKMVLTLPSNCVIRENSKVYVYRMEDGIKVKTQVKTGISTDAYTEITEGLKEGDEIYVPS